jgi:hypothetical protein
MRKNGMQQLRTSASATIFTSGASPSALPSKDTVHGREVQASAAQQPATHAQQPSVPLLDTGLTCHFPPKCSMHTLPSPRLRYSTRPSSPFSSVGSNTPLMRAAWTPVAPLMNKGSARALSWATALASAAACSALCAKTNTSQRKQCAGGGGGGRAAGSSQPDAPLQHPPPSSQAARLQALCRRKTPSMGVKCRLQLRSRLQPTPSNPPCLCSTQV